MCSTRLATVVLPVVCGCFGWCGRCSAEGPRGPAAAGRGDRRRVFDVTLVGVVPVSRPTTGQGEGCGVAPVLWVYGCGWSAAGLSGTSMRRQPVLSHAHTWPCAVTVSPIDRLRNG